MGRPSGSRKTSRACSRAWARRSPRRNPPTRCPVPRWRLEVGGVSRQDRVRFLSCGASGMSGGGCHELVGRPRTRSGCASPVPLDAPRVSKGDRTPGTDPPRRLAQPRQAAQCARPHRHNRLGWPRWRKGSCMRCRYIDRTAHPPVEMAGANCTGLDGGRGCAHSPSNGFGAGQVEGHADGGLAPGFEPVTGAGHPPPQSPGPAVPVADEHLEVEPRLLGADHTSRPAALRIGLQLRYHRATRRAVPGVGSDDVRSISSRRPSRRLSPKLVRVSGGEPADAARSACGPGQGRQPDMNAAVEPTAFSSRPSASTR